MADFTINTPWGRAHHYQNLGQGVFVVHTDSHGGYFVPDYYLENIPAERRAEAARWSGSEQWYEEDCCAAFVVDALPHLFTHDAVERARGLLHAMEKYRR